MSILPSTGFVLDCSDLIEHAWASQGHSSSRVPDACTGWSCEIIHRRTCQVDKEYVWSDTGQS
eukprot:766248-Hanusia_phi.AAC.11